MDAILLGKVRRKRHLGGPDSVELAAKGVTVLNVSRAYPGDLEAAERITTFVESIGDADSVAIPSVNITGRSGQAEYVILVESVIPTTANIISKIVHRAAHAGDIL